MMAKSVVYMHITLELKSYWLTCFFFFFFCRIEFPTNFFMLVSLMVFAFCFQVPEWLPWSPIWAQPLGLASGYTCSRHMCCLMLVYGPCQECMEWLFPPLLRVGESFMVLNPLAISHSVNMLGHIALGAWQNHPIPQSPLHAWKGSSLPGFVPLQEMVDADSVVGIKHGHSSVMIRYQGMNLLTLGQKSILLLDHTFTQGLQL